MEFRGELTHALESLLALEPTSNPSPYEVFSTVLNICASAQRKHPDIQIFKQICELLVEASEISRDATRSHEISQLTRAPIDLLNQLLHPANSIIRQIPEAASRHCESHDNGPLLFNVVDERTDSYHLKKIIAQEASLRALGEKMQGKWTVLGLYGEYQNCLRVARQLLEIPDLDLPSVGEGVAGLYSESKRTLILAVIDRELLYFQDRPYVPKNISTQLIRYLLDVANTIIVCPSDEQLQHWYFNTTKTLINPYVTRTHSISKKKGVEKSTPPIAPESIHVVNAQQDLSGLELDGDGMNSAFIVKGIKLSSDREKKIAKSYKLEFMEFIKQNIKSLKKGKSSVVRAYDDKLLELWVKLKDTSNSRNLNLDDMKQTLTEELKKQYSTDIDFLTKLIRSDDRIKRMSEELDSVIDKLFENSFEVTIERINIDIPTKQGVTSLNLIKNKQVCFSGMLSLPVIQACQVLTLSQESMLALFRHEDKTVSFNIKTNFGIRFNEATQNSIDKSLIVVPGSTAEHFFAYSNTRKWARSGPLEEAYGVEQGYNYDCVFSEETTEIIAGFYLKTKRQLVYINQSGTVFSINFNDADRTPTKVLDSSGSPLRTSDMFLDVRVPDNEQVYVFRTDFAFVIYNTDFSYFDQIICRASQYKVINDSHNCIYLISLGDTLQGWKFAVGGIVTLFEDQSAAREVILGNPIVDVLQCAIGKFGICDETEETRELLILSDLKTQAEVLKYTKALPHCRQHFQTIKTLDFQEFTSYSLSRNIEGPAAFQLLASRVPLHIASIMGQSLMPLKNGEIVNSTSKSDEVDLSAHLLKMIEFGLYETELLKAKHLKVVSIIGRQSSGKSYLLNRLFGTRFDVATERCTDGIWMSMTVLEGQTFVVLDCEGLLSSVRTSQDEMRMCLALAAVSDVLIFNTDISGINKQSQKLFESMNSACDRLKGEELFKGKLWITIRDVSDSQLEGMQSEIDTTLESLRVANKVNFIKELFDNNWWTVCIHSYEKIEDFASDIEQSIVELLELPGRWQDGSTFLERFKMTLVQIRTNDDLGQDERMLPMKVDKAKKVVESIDSDPVFALTHLGDLAFTHNFVVGQTPFTLTLTEYIDTSSGLLNFAIKFLAATSIELKKPHHNEWHTELNRFIKAYFERRKELALQFIDKLFGKAASIQGEVEKQKQDASNHLDVHSGKTSLCLKSCRGCSNVCVEDDAHESIHDCNTDHKCIQQCKLCPGNKCSRQAGHLDYHYCASGDHLCQSNCSVQGCSRSCSKSHGHSQAIECKCEVMHMCQVVCQLRKCHRKCSGTLEVPHPLHSCGDPCPYPCELCGGKCSSDDHFHSLNTRTHLCRNTHSCKNKCAQPGLCKTEIKAADRRMYDEGPSRFEYDHYESFEESFDCVIKIPEGELGHDGTHICGKPHRCTSKCPCCSVYCNMGHGHSGLHESPKHASQQNMVYTPQTSSSFTVAIQGIDQQFVSGNTCKAETCLESCRSKRACHQLITCKGRSECLAKKYPTRAFHCPTKYAHSDEIKDKVRCDLYYELRNWRSPLETLNQHDFREHLKCSWYCDSHPDGEKFCSEPLFHAGAHRYACGH
jgi:hypothetical protein